MTASEVSHLLPFSDDTIRRWDKEVLEKQLGKVDLSKVQRLLIDEKSIGKHHKYITLVLDAVPSLMLKEDALNSLTMRAEKCCL